jgi:type IV fimbrial biogenesis protein FimT
MSTRAASAFTLVELIVVMALLAVVLALAAPSLGRSMRQRTLDDEATRFLAATEYARDEAVSQGIPMIVWINPDGTSFGVEAKAGFEGNDTRSREFVLDEDVKLESDQKTRSNGVNVVMEFSPDGNPETSSVEEVRAVSRDEPPLHIAKARDKWRYEIVKEER